MPADFEAFVKDVHPYMHNLALALTGGDVHEARDLVQSAFERIWSRWNRIEIDSPRAYTRTVVTREFATTRRRVRWRRERLESDTPESSIEDFSGSSDQALFVLQALRGLPRRQREVVVLRYLEDMSISEVASILSCSEGTVKRSSHDGVLALKSVLRKPAETE